MPVYEKEVLKLEFAEKNGGKWPVLTTRDDKGEKKLNIINNPAVEAVFTAPGAVPGRYKFTMEKPQGAKFWTVVAAEKVNGAVQSQPQDTKSTDAAQPGPQSAAPALRPMEPTERYRNRAITFQVIAKAVADMVSAFSQQTQEPLKVPEAAQLTRELTDLLTFKADAFLGEVKIEKKD